MFHLQAIVVEKKGAYVRKRIRVLPSYNVVFHPLRWSDTSEDDLFPVVHLDTDQSILINSEQLTILKALYSGMPLSSALEYSSDTSVSSFLQYLIQSHFIKQIGNYHLLDVEKKIEPWLPNVNSNWFRPFISKVLLFILFIFILSGVIISFLHLEYFPSFSQYFWSENLFLVYVSLFIISWTGGLYHELLHYCVTRAIGGQGRIVLFNNRFIDLVFETESYYINLFPKTYRYLVYFAGIFGDLVLIALSYWLILLNDMQFLSLGYWRGILFALILSKITGVIWEFNVYLETDVYNFFADYIGEGNLYTDTKRYLGRKSQSLHIPYLRKTAQFFSKLFLTKDVLENSNDLRFFSQLERRELKWYSIFMIIGLLFSLFSFICLVLPREIWFVLFAVAQLYQGYLGHNLIMVLESLFILFFFLYSYIVLFIIMMRKIINRVSII